jgi:ABC-2 type transport system ATP-binding protein
MPRSEASSAGGAAPALELRALSRRFGARQVIRRLDLAVEEGERVALRGPNGSGKTTVIRCAAGTLTPSSGEIYVARQPAGTLEARRALGVSLPQERSFYQRLSGHDNLLFFARLRCADRREAERRVRAVEHELELDEIASERVDRCSAGMLQQLAFARALLGEPRVLLLDEPTRSLDADAVGRFWGAIERRKRAAVLVATHRDDDACRCDSRLELPS